MNSCAETCSRLPAQSVLPIDKYKVHIVTKRVRKIKIVQVEFEDDVTHVVTGRVAVSMQLNMASLNLRLSTHINFLADVYKK